MADEADGSVVLAQLQVAFLWECATGVKLRGREDITIATWNVRTQRAAGKVAELLHEISG